MAQGRLKKYFGYPVVYDTFSVLGRISKKIFKEFELYILAYHRINKIDENFSFYEDVVTATKDEFDKQIKYISEKYEVISFKDLTEKFDEEKYDKELMIITFDDGYKDFKTNALPVLKKYGIGATVYITPSFASNNDIGWWEKLSYAFKTTKLNEVTIKQLDIKRESIEYLKNNGLNKIIEETKYFPELKKKELLDSIISELEVDLDVERLSKELYLDWSDLKSTKTEKIEFGSHSLTHPILTNLDRNRLYEEIYASKQVIEDRLDVEVDSFCYPNGRNRDFNENVIEMLKEAGYRSAVTMLFGSNRPKSLRFNLFTLRRVNPINSKYIERQLNATPFSGVLNAFL